MSRENITGVPTNALRRLREVMAAHISAQERLTRIVRLVAMNMVAEVCSIYLVQGNDLVLSATEGLNADAVGRTTLAWGEGLVGEVAAKASPLNLTDARSHPKFAYKPETGEDPYQSLLGVPILRAGNTLGVLVIQNRVKRSYAEEEVELLETIAMVLAEIVSTSDVLGDDDEEAPDVASAMSLKGLPLAEGIAIGTAVLHAPRVRITRLFAEDLTEELGRLQEAIGALHASVDRMLSNSRSQSLAGESRKVLEAYRMFAYDEGWLKRLREAVRTGLSAEAAVEQVHNNTRARLHRQRNPYIRERLHDLDDLANRLLRHLAGKPTTAAGDDMPDDAIIIARSMGPAELLDYDPKKLRGLILEEGSPASHVAIVARALQIPLVGFAPGVTDHCETGDQVVLDGEVGDIYLRPDPTLLKSYGERQAIRDQRLAAFAALRSEPAETEDGQSVTLRMNAGLLMDLTHLEETGADGIGLFRTELQFMVSSTMPGLRAQTALYSQVMEAAEERPVVFRTLDLGGDKALTYGGSEKEENPALGWRAIRIALDRPALLRYQLRALLTAAAGRPLNVMFPMVAEVDEFIRARELVDVELERCAKLGKPIPAQIRIGTMLEVPSLAWQLDALLPLVDFISVGSNDLMQFLFACDRDNARIAGRYDPLSPAVLSFMRHVLTQAQNHGVEISVCGEMAGRPLESMALIGLGYRTISMPPSCIGPVKAMVRSLHAGKLNAYMVPLLASPEHSLRDALSTFAREHGVNL